MKSFKNVYNKDLTAKKIPHILKELELREKKD